MKKILIVDEESISVRGILYLIEHRLDNVAPTVCKTCSSALVALKNEKYDLLILDMMLPKGDWQRPPDRADNLYGIDLLAEIRLELSETDLPIICYTVLDNDLIKSKIQALGGVYLCKNVEKSRELLVSSINKLIK
jgi:CheY-like chemotaxis protein